MKAIVAVMITVTTLFAQASITCSTHDGSIQMKGSTLSEGIAGIYISDLTMDGKNLKRGVDFTVSGAYADSSNLFIEVLDGVGNKLFTLQAVMSLSAGDAQTPLALGFARTKKDDRVIRCEFLQ